MTAMSVRETPEHVLHREELERRVEALEEIVRTQANELASLREMPLPVPTRVHGGQRK